MNKRLDGWHCIVAALSILLFAGGIHSVRAQGTGKASGIETGSEKNKQGKDMVMDKCHPEKDAQKQKCGLNSVDVMQNEPKPGVKPANADKETLDMQTPIGDATLDKDGSTIVINLRRTATGMNVSGIVKYPKDSPYYKTVMDHLQGLKPGETKLVLPFKDDEK